MARVRSSPTSSRLAEKLVTFLWPIVQDECSLVKHSEEVTTMSRTFNLANIKSVFIYGSDLEGWLYIWTCVCVCTLQASVANMVHIIVLWSLWIWKQICYVITQAGVANASANSFSWVQLRCHQTCNLRHDKKKTTNTWNYWISMSRKCMFVFFKLNTSSILKKNLYY